MNPLQEAREAVGAALGPVSVPVHTFPPTSVSAPCVVLLPGSPWITPRGQVAMEVTCFASLALGNGPAQVRLEDLATEVGDALKAGGIPHGDLTPPIADTTAGLLSATYSVTLRIC